MKINITKVLNSETLQWKLEAEESAHEEICITGFNIDGLAIDFMITARTDELLDLAEFINQTVKEFTKNDD